MNCSSYESYGCTREMMERNCIYRFFRSIKGFVLVLALASFLHGMVDVGLVTVNISTIERRFQFTSIKSGILASCYDITACVLSPVITYIGSKRHRPRITAIGITMMALGSVLNAVPHFTSNKYVPPGNLSDDGLCSETRNASITLTNESPLPFALFTLGFIMLGAASVPLLTVGLAYIDDNTTKGKSASYVGVIGGCAGIGTVCGYLMGGYSLSFYVDSSNDYDLSHDDPAWVGNWWASYLLTASFAICVALAVMQFPKTIQRKGTANGENQHQRNIDHSTVSAPSKINTCDDILTTLKTFMKNPVFMPTIISSGLEAFAVLGMAVFIPKLLQNQFLVSPTMASILAGTISVPGSSLGFLASGYVIRRFRMNIETILKTTCIATFISVIIMLSFMLHCPSPVAGRNSDNCLIEDKCQCDSNVYRPVCGNDGNLYFSPCHAGCNERSANGEAFYNCSCINGNRTYGGGFATKGVCDEGCKTVIPFLILLFIGIFLNTSLTVPTLMVVMRSVPEDKKTFAVGLQWFAIRLLGSIPGPMIIGKVFDASCVVWMKRENSNVGFCWVYNNEEFAKSAVILLVTMKILSLLSISIAFWQYRKGLQRTPEVGEDMKVEEEQRGLKGCDDSRM